MHSPEPRFSRIAAVIADPTRARMLAALLGGEYRSAGELAKLAGITPQAASTQLAQLLDNGLIAMRQQGRHKYFALADADVAHALEALSIVAERDNISARWDKPAYQPLKCARRCYGHMAGELGVAQFEMLMRKQYLAPAEQGLQFTEAGRAWAEQLGLELPKKSTTRFAYPCMDWSERKDHLAGSLAKALLELFIAKNWLRAPRESRALELTHLGQQALMPLLKSA
jgi:DNA-binding transcriptional ArsR family regulator